MGVGISPRMRRGIDCYNKGRVALCRRDKYVLRPSCIDPWIEEVVGAETANGDVEDGFDGI